MNSWQNYKTGDAEILKEAKKKVEEMILNNWIQF